MTTHDAGIAALIGAVLPILIAVILQSHWTDGAKAVVAFLVCAAAAVLTSFLSDSVRWDDPGWNWVTWFGSMYGAAMILYARFYRPTNVAPTIEAKTNLAKVPPPS